jgi:sigma-E factor negative regulatory protein RseC
VIEESAVVISCTGEFADIETERKSSCGGCSANGVCGVGVLAKVFGRRRSIVRVVNSINAKEGDRVIVGLQDGALVRGSFVFYIVPILTMIAGAIFSDMFAVWVGLTTTEPFSIFGGLLGLMFGLLLARRFSETVSTDERYRVVMLRHEHQSVNVKFDTPQ